MRFACQGMFSAHVAHVGWSEPSEPQRIGVPKWENHLPCAPVQSYGYIALLCGLRSREHDNLAGIDEMRVLDLVFVHLPDFGPPSGIM